MTEPPAEVLLAAIDHSLRTGAKCIDAEIALNEVCRRLGVERATLKYERGWAKKYIT